MLESNVKHTILNVALPKRAGFTLIELLLYITLTGIILVSVSVFLSVILESRVKNQAIAEVDGQGAQVLQIITQAVRNATAINSPAAGSSSDTLSISTTVAGNNPTIFDLSGGVIRIKEGSGSPVPLTSSLVTASGLNFQNLTRPDTPGNINISFTLTSIH